MEKVNLNAYTRKNLNHELKKEYVESCKNPEFRGLINKLKIKDDVAYKYTSKLETTLNELCNCKNCKSINECKNKVYGYVFFPTLKGEKLEFNYNPCKYMKKLSESESKNKCKYYELPLMIRNARMKNIDTSDKKRAPIIKWLKKFYDEYPSNNHIKGLYLNGSFGSGKTYLISSLLNELGDKGYKIVMVHFPEFILSLKSFGPDYQARINELKKSDIILLDDIGAEVVSSWSRDEVLGTILQYRMDNCLPTFFTSNYTVEELEEKEANSKNGIENVSSRRVIERVKQLTNQLTLNSENRRK